MRCKPPLTCVIHVLLLLHYTTADCRSWGHVRQYREDIKYCDYQHHGHKQRLYYHGNPVFRDGSPSCTNKCYLRYTRLNRARVPVYHFTTAPVYTDHWSGHPPHRSRDVYLQRPYYTVNSGQTYVVRGALYKGYRPVYSQYEDQQNHVILLRQGCRYQGRLVPYNRTVYRRQCVGCQCLRSEGHGRFRCQTNMRCVSHLSESRQKEIMMRHLNKYSVNHVGCTYKQVFIPFNHKRQVEKCKFCKCSGKIGSAKLSCEVDVACVRGGCLFRGKLVPHNNSIRVGCKRCACLAHKGRSVIYCKSDDKCEKDKSKSLLVEVKHVHSNSTVHHHDNSTTAADDDKHDDENDDSGDKDTAGGEDDKDDYGKDADDHGRGDNDENNKDDTGSDGIKKDASGKGDKDGEKDTKIEDDGKEDNGKEPKDDTEEDGTKGNKDTHNEDHGGKGDGERDDENDIDTGKDGRWKDTPIVHHDEEEGSGTGEDHKNDTGKDASGSDAKGDSGVDARGGKDSPIIDHHDEEHGGTDHGEDTGKDHKGDSGSGRGDSVEDGRIDNKDSPFVDHVNTITTSVDDKHDSENNDGGEKHTTIGEDNNGDSGRDYKGDEGSDGKNVSDEDGKGDNKDSPIVEDHGDDHDHGRGDNDSPNVDHDGEYRGGVDHEKDSGKTDERDTRSDDKSDNMDTPTEDHNGAKDDTGNDDDTEHGIDGDRDNKDTSLEDQGDKHVCHYKHKIIEDGAKLQVKKCISCICRATSTSSELHCSYEEACVRTTVIFYEEEHQEDGCHHNNRIYSYRQRFIIRKKHCKCDEFDGVFLIRCSKGTSGAVLIENNESDVNIERKKKTRRDENNKDSTVDVVKESGELVEESKTVVIGETDVTFSIKRNQKGCYFDGDHVEFDDTVVRKCIVCLCLRHSKYIFYCRRKPACLKAAQVGPQCNYDGKSYVTGEPIRMNCKQCFCGLDAKSKPLIRCYKDPACVENGDEFCVYQKKKYPMGIVFKTKKCLRCACVFYSGQPHIHCRMDKGCTGEVTEASDTSVTTHSNQHLHPQQQYQNQHYGQHDQHSIPQWDDFGRRFHFEDDDEYGQERKRTLNIYVQNRRGGYDIRKKEKEESHCSLNGERVPLLQGVKLSDCRVCICINVHEPGFYCRKDPSCKTTRVSPEHEHYGVTATDDANDGTNSEQPKLSHVEKCMIKSTSIALGSVFRLSRCTICKCKRDSSRQLYVSCKYDEGCDNTRDEEDTDTPMTSESRVGCRRQGVLYRYGSGFNLTVCKVCNCSKELESAGAVFLCRVKESCKDTPMIHSGTTNEKMDSVTVRDRDTKGSEDTNMVTGGGDGGIQGGSNGDHGDSGRDGASGASADVGVHGDASGDGGSSAHEDGDGEVEKTPVLITVKKKVMCSYKGKQTELGKKRKISGCLVCICKQQKYNPVFDCSRDEVCEKELKERKRNARDKKHRTDDHHEHTDNDDQIDKQIDEHSDEEIDEHIDQHDMDKHIAMVVDDGHGAPERPEKGNEDTFVTTRENGRKKTSNARIEERLVQDAADDIGMVSSSSPVYGNSRVSSLKNSRRPWDHANQHQPPHNGVYSNFRNHDLSHMRGAVFARDQQGTGCSYSGTVIPRGHRLYVNGCVVCHCTGYGEDVLVCVQRPHCRDEVTPPGCREGGVVIPRRGVVLRGECRYCKCYFGANGFSLNCHQQRHCDVTNKPPQAFRPGAYSEHARQQGCELSYGIIITNGASVFDKAQCITCTCRSGDFHCAQHNSEHCNVAEGCYVDGRYAAPHSQVYRGCRACTCQKTAFSCTLEPQCLQQHL